MADTTADAATVAMAAFTTTPSPPLPSPLSLPRPRLPCCGYVSFPPSLLLLRVHYLVRQIDVLATQLSVYLGKGKALCQQESFVGQHSSLVNTRLFLFANLLILSIWFCLAFMALFLFYVC